MPRTESTQLLPAGTFPEPNITRRLTRTSEALFGQFIHGGPCMRFKMAAALTPGRILAILLLLIAPILANVEKTIFLGPEPVNARLSHSLLSTLTLHTLTPTNGAIRARLAAQFPSTTHPSGTATWLILDKLTPNQRYEVRVCWPATQPTAFTLDTFPLSAVQTTPELLASLHNSSSAAAAATTTSSLAAAAAAAAPSPGPPLASPTPKSDEASAVLLLRILAAADYFTTDAALMRTVPPVDVDIILDPFLFNILPRSLAGTACYVVAVAVGAYFLSRRIAAWIQGLIAASGAAEPEGSGRMEKRKKMQ
ncbi:hypothetical protein VTK26DRAFT_5133 [Humicola hyalothermophila]